MFCGIVQSSRVLPVTGNDETGCGPMIGPGIPTCIADVGGKLAGKWGGIPWTYEDDMAGKVNIEG